MKRPVLDLDGKSLGEVELSDAIFAAPVREDLLQRTVVWQLAKRRSGSAKVRSRGEMAYSRRKMFRQKGTGNARRGDRRTNILRGGGIAHGPVPRSFAIGLPKRVRRQALCAALSSKAASGDLHILAEAKAGEAKTKPVAEKLAKLGWQDALLLESEPAADKNFLLSVRNLETIKVLPSEGANVHDILRRKSLVVTKAALAELEARLAAEKTAEKMGQ